MAEYMESNVTLIRVLIEDNKTYKHVSEILRQNFPEVTRGFSERNVRLFCAKYGIRRLNEYEVDSIVQDCVNEVGPTYGRKMMTGYVRSKVLGLRGKQVSKSLRRVNPVNHSRRREDTVRRQNPVPYYAPYFGNKLH
ncbi:unnamed protein product, partial [Porites lobata]